MWCILLWACLYLYFFTLFCSISHAEMNVVLHSIYGAILDFPEEVDVGYMSDFLSFFNFSLCLSDCSIFSQLKIKRKTQKKKKAVEEILFIWQLLEKVCQLVLEYSMRRVKNRMMFYTKTIPNWPVASFSFSDNIYTICITVNIFNFFLSNHARWWKGELVLDPWKIIYRN